MRWIALFMAQMVISMTVYGQNKLYSPSYYSSVVSSIKIFGPPSQSSDVFNRAYEVLGYSNPEDLNADFGVLESVTIQNRGEHLKIKVGGEVHTLTGMDFEKGIVFVDGASLSLIDAKRSPSSYSRTKRLLLLPLVLGNQ